ncbi:hypothetical protein EYF80_026554 [Liparis tanakae]|uniref:Uncharacterized protein n=1 Tax=Liparis tanakae TaxID=230148 RepID=A0A4Z2HC57_9TELE|nr:hypothetical protein EYF80_026554 [Liparis tanakae]
MLSDKRGEVDGMENVEKGRRADGGERPKTSRRTKELNSQSEKAWQAKCNALEERFTEDLAA